MSSQIPVVRNRSSWRVAAVVTFLVLIVGAFVLFQPVARLSGIWWTFPWLIETLGAMWLFLLVFGLPRLVLYRRWGIRPFRLIREQFPEQVAASDAGVAFLERHPWIDRWRLLLFAEISAYALREIALMNKAYALCRQDRMDEGFALYERIAVEYPGNKLSRTTLDFRNKVLAQQDRSAPGQ